MSRKKSSKNDSSEEVAPEQPTRQEQRQKRREKERQRMLQHGRSLGKVYRDAVLKRGGLSKNTNQKQSDDVQKPQTS